MIMDNVQDQGEVTVSHVCCKLNGSNRLYRGESVTNGVMVHQAKSSISKGYRFKFYNKQKNSWLKKVNNLKSVRRQNYILNMLRKEDFSTISEMNVVTNDEVHDVLEDETVEEEEARDETSHLDVQVY